jgi:hypothetical protein
VPVRKSVRDGLFFGRKFWGLRIGASGITAVGRDPSNALPSRSLDRSRPLQSLGPGGTIALGGVHDEIGAPALFVVPLLGGRGLTYPIGDPVDATIMACAQTVIIEPAAP